jgi:hypothetical protein
MTRNTYLLPPPSAVAGLVGAILGIPRTRLKYWSEEKNLLSGAELKKLEGFAVECARLFKFDRNAEQLKKLFNQFTKGSNEACKEIAELRPLKKSEALFGATYKYAVSSSDEAMLEELLKRLRTLDFQYEIFGGNDYNFPLFIDKPLEAKIIKSKAGRGYCPTRLLESLKAERNYQVISTLRQLSTSGPIIVPGYVSAEVREPYLFAYGADLIVREELDTVDDGESRIFVYPAWKFVEVADSWRD